MGKEGLSSKDFLLGTVIGGLVGAATALLLAPKPGKELRSDINDQAAYIRLKTEQVKDLAVEKGQELAETAKDKTIQLSDSITTQSSQMVNKVKGIKKAGADEEEMTASSVQLPEDEEEMQSPASETMDAQQKLEEAKHAFDEVEHNIKS